MIIKAVAFDVDGPIIEGTKLWDTLNDYAGIKKRMDKLVEQYLNDQISFRNLNLTVVRFWKENKLPLSKIDEIGEKIELMPGTEEVITSLKRKYGDDKIGLISVGFDRWVTKVQRRLGIKYAKCNVLEVIGNDYTGNVIYYVDDQNKGLMLKELCREMKVDPKEVAVICDGREDIPMCEIAGLSIAFNPIYQPLKKRAKIIIEGNNLIELLKYL